MARTTQVPVQLTATALPETLDPTRSSVLVENLGAEAIWVSHTEGALASGEGHKVAAGAYRTFGGGPLWAVAESLAQGGGAGDTTIITEYP